MGLLDTVIVGVEDRPLRALIHGVPGIGKSFLAAGAPSPLFLDAEEGTRGLDVAKAPIRHWSALVGGINDLTTKPHDFKTVVLDTLDAFERLLCVHICGGNADSIENVGGGFGKGWQRAAEEWAKVGLQLARLQEERGMGVIAIAHSEVGTVSDPSGEDYSHWQMRMNKKSLSFWRGWVNDILFYSREIHTKHKSRKVDERRSGGRYLVTSWRPGVEAKNRSGLPDLIPVPDTRDPRVAWSAITGPVEEPAGEPRRPVKP